jgi:class 3 adenylate cyclase
VILWYLSEAVFSGGNMGQKKKPVGAFVVSLLVFIGCVLVCFLRQDLLKQPVFNKTTVFNSPSSAKYEKDGNLYVIDNGAFRLICMNPKGEINYIITVDKMEEYVKLYDSVVDEKGNLYVYASEWDYDKFFTKRDIIRKYDRFGSFESEIFTLTYREDDENPHTSPQFGSLACEDGILTFSRVQRNQVTLYRYDTLREKLTSSGFSKGGNNFLVSQLAVKDFDNFVYSTRRGDIFEVVNGAEPSLKASYDYAPDQGGINPWYIEYNPRGVLFFDMASGTVLCINRDGVTGSVVPRTFFEKFGPLDDLPPLTDFGAFADNYAGVYGESVWYYNGREFKVYEDSLILPVKEQNTTAAVQLCFVAGIITFIAALYILFMHLLDRYISLLIKQTVIIIPLLIVSFMVIYNMTFDAMIGRLDQDILNKLSFSTLLSSRIINGDDVDSLKTIKDFGSDAYLRLSENLKEITGYNRDEWNKDFFASIYKGRHFEYWMLVSNDEVGLFRPSLALEESSEEYKRFISGKPVINIVQAIDGYWANAQVPIYNSRNEIAGMLELGIDMTSYQISNAMQRRKISLLVAGISFGITMVLLGVLGIIIRQMLGVVRVLRSITAGNYSARVEYRGRDELGNVITGLNQMVVELQTQFAVINNLTKSSLRFVPVQFMEHLGVKDITKLKLGDHVRSNLTVLFFDIRSFSIHSEMMSVQENFEFINRVLGLAGPILRKYNGFVDKYLGDAAMALFEDAHDAVMAGIEVYRKLILDKKTRIKIGSDGINIGVGLHSGSVMMGIIGENERLSSTVISKTVNMASRMESLTKQTGSGMLITRDTFNQIRETEGDFQYRFIGMIQVAGVNEITGTFDILDALPAKIRAKRIATKEIFESGIRKYHTKDYIAALDCFKQVVQVDPGDICAQNCLLETQKHLKNPQMSSVFVFNRK